MKKIPPKIKDVMRKAIEDSRSLGGSSWRDYSQKEIISIYGYLPSWAVELKED